MLGGPRPLLAGWRPVTRQDILLEVSDLKVHFPVGGMWSKLGGAKSVRAVDGVNFAVERGSALGLVGESGCGKTTTGMAILRLLDTSTGLVTFDGQELSTLDAAALRPYRRRIQIIFQDAYASLNPRMSIGDGLAEPLVIHNLFHGRRQERVRQLLDMVGLPGHFTHRYPHELSGGQLQRVTIARALAVEPELIICDEPVSALDVSIQAQIINLLKDLQRDLGLTYLFISHDLSVVRNLCDQVVVMYLGRVTEIASRRQLFDGAVHPYTKALMSAVPIPDPDVEATRERVILTGDLPSPSDPPSGCRFRTRCPIAIDECAEIVPEVQEVADGHWAACIRI
jgi:oligopeptide transport system ATP-binding protein